MTGIRTQYAMKPQGWRASACDPSRNALTLIELLAVILLLGLVAGSAIVNLGSMDGSARMEETAHQIRQLDRAARQLARTEGAAIIARRNKALVLQQPRTGESARQFTAADGIEIQLHGTDEQLLDAIAYDASGRSADLRIAITNGEWTRSFIIHGLTGAVEEIRERQP